MSTLSFAGFESLPISESDKHRLAREVDVLKFHKGELIIRQNECCSRVFFIRSGLIKLSYITLEGKEFIKSFLQKGDLLGSLYSQISGGGSTFNAEAMDAVEVEALDYCIFQELIEKNTSLQLFALNFFRHLALKKEMREYELLCLSAEQRYERFCEKHPLLVKKIKQADLALYLGITPIALSRIKHRVS